MPIDLDVSLARFFAPRSIVVVGASDRPGSFGQRTQANLGVFKGKVYLVNPGRDEIAGLPSFRSLADLPESPDCVVLATPQPTVEGLVEECVAVEAGAAAISSSPTSAKPEA